MEMDDIQKYIFDVHVDWRSRRMLRRRRRQLEMERNGERVRESRGVRESGRDGESERDGESQTSSLESAAQPWGAKAALLVGACLIVAHRGVREERSPFCGGKDMTSKATLPRRQCLRW